MLLVISVNRVSNLGVDLFVPKSSKYKVIQAHRALISMASEEINEPLPSLTHHVGILEVSVEDLLLFLGVVATLHHSLEDTMLPECIQITTNETTDKNSIIISMSHQVIIVEGLHL
jgi:hypothetical protein